MKARPTLRKLLGLLLSLVLMAGVLPTTVFAAGMPFTDVKSDAWYYNDVKIAYEGSLINGKSATTFEPNANLTYAEAVKLAACMHQKSTIGSVTLKNGDPWYQSYADYCRLNGIISKDYNWNTKATRAGYMEIFASALPEESLKATNSVADGAIPDVPAKHPQAAAIYKLYRAGILQGVDKEYRCNPDANIKRCEVATILTRMMNEESRLSFTVGETVTSDLKLVTLIEDFVLKSDNETRTLTVGVSGGTAPYTYQWIIQYGYYRGQYGEEEYVHTSSSTTDSLEVTFDETLFSHCGKFDMLWIWCEITDAEGNAVKSNYLDVFEYTPCKIYTQPEDVTTTEGGQAKLRVDVTGSATPYTYTWQSYSQGVWRDLIDTEDCDIDEDTIVLTASKKTWTTNEDIRCVITDAAGNTVTSDSVRVSIEADPLTITTQPEDVATAKGTQADLTVEVVGGTAPYTYEWQIYTQDRWDIMDEGCADCDLDENTIHLIASTWTTDGPIRCIITDAAGNTVTSDSVNLSIEANPLTITTQPKDVTTTKGAQADLTVEVVGGTAPYTYEWQIYTQDRWDIMDEGCADCDLDGNTIHLIASTWTTDGPIRCIITDAAGNTVTSDSVNLSIEANPLTITTQPKNVTTTNGGQIELTVAVTGGTAPYTYEWQVNTRSVWLALHDGDWDCDLDGDRICLTISGKTWASGGAIRCVITDAAGNSVTSKGALITVK